MSRYLGEKLISGTGVPDDITVSSITPLIELGPERTESWTTMLFSDGTLMTSQSWTPDSANRIFIFMPLDSPTTQIIVDANAATAMGSSLGLNYDPARTDAFTGDFAITWIPTVFTLTAGGSTFTFDFATFNATTEDFNDLRFQYEPDQPFSVLTVDDETGGTITTELVTWLNANAVATNVTVSFTYRTREIGVQTIDIPSLPTVAQTGDGIWNKNGSVNIGEDVSLVETTDLTVSSITPGIATRSLTFTVPQVFSDTLLTAQTWTPGMSFGRVIFAPGPDQVILDDEAATAGSFDYRSPTGVNTWIPTLFTLTAGLSTFTFDIDAFGAVNTTGVFLYDSIGTFHSEFVISDLTTDSPFALELINWLNANAVGVIPITVNVAYSTVNARIRFNDLPTAQPGQLDVLWNNNGSLNIGAGNRGDNYTLGLWTPEAEFFIATDGTTDFTGASGSYIKTDSLVWCRFIITIPPNTDVSVITIDGLPFVPIIGSSAGIFSQNSTTTTRSPQGWMSTGSGVVISLYGSSSPTDTTTHGLSYSTQPGVEISGSFTYQTTA